MKIIIIGAGIAGIASAIRLAAKGHLIEVYEANSYPGGKLSSFELGDYRFDAGPSLFTMPHFVEDLFVVAKKDIQQYFKYKKLETVCHYFWEDGTQLFAPSNIYELSTLIEETLGVDRAIIINYFAKSKQKYDITAPVFLEQSLHLFKNFLTTDFIKGVLSVPFLDIFKTMNAVNKKLNHPKLIQLFNRFATYNGSNPYEAPGILTTIPHLEHGIGTYFPEGGMNSITKSLYQLAMDLGVVFHFNKKVDEIIVENKKATGIIVKNHQTKADIVVSNMDVFFTYRKLLPKEKAPEKTLSQPKSSSALIFYWGIQKTFQQLGLHNILFSENYKKEFDCIFNQKTIYEDPTIYINITKKYNTSDAPNNCENWFVMINVPHNENQDWDELIALAKKQIISKINRILKVNLDELIECEQILNPRSIESKTQSHLGSLYGTSSNNRMAAFLRHPNFSTTIKNLYFCGGSVHPGGGIPLCLLSAKIVSDIIPN